jgi:2-amino-4-hydroxy-6-hydroxymethyldihydropteridine diphosphokinase
MNQAFVLLGGNQGDVASTFERARQMIASRAGKITACSSLYQSQAWGFESDDPFLNQVLEVASGHHAPGLMRELLQIEEDLGRMRKEGVMSSRTIDIDLLFFNQEVIDQPGLQVPHPRLHLRRFTLLPLAELAPELIHPIMGKTIEQLLESCPDQGHVIRVKPINKSTE